MPSAVNRSHGRVCAHLEQHSFEAYRARSTAVCDGTTRSRARLVVDCSRGPVGWRPCREFTTLCRVCGRGKCHETIVRCSEDRRGEGGTPGLVGLTADQGILGERSTSVRHRCPETRFLRLPRMIYFVPGSGSAGANFCTAPHYHQPWEPGPAQGRA
ncbi:hypothetical protein BC628DRAFT_369338 [Trametes gibbosa]|nr:hypothetical protein BC628DRAFT_369338 [Trametes gibbosa]